MRLNLERETEDMMGTQLDDFIRRADEAVAGKLSQQEQESLKRELYAAYRRYPETMHIAQATDKGWPEVRAALGSYRDKNEHELAVANAGGVSVSATANASASSDVSIALTNAMRAVEESKLTPEQVGEIQQLILDTKNGARKGLKPFTQKASELLRKAGEYTAPIAEIISIIQAAVQLLPPMQA